MPQNAKNKKAVEISGEAIQKRKDPHLRLWTARGLEDVFYQREAQVNFWTVLGGLAMAALLTQLSPLLREIQASRWYLLLYLFTSILVLANSWVQTSWGSLVMKWPISIATTIIMLFQMLVHSIQCLMVTNPSGWLAATAGIIFFALANQIYFEWSGAWQVYSPESIKRYKFNNNIYIVLMLICLGGAYQLYRFPSHIAEIIWGFAALLLSIMALFMQHKTMQIEKKIMAVP
jgi:hypothetical protein